VLPVTRARVLLSSLRVVLVWDDFVASPELCAPELWVVAWFEPDAPERCADPLEAALSAFPLLCFGSILLDEPDDCSVPPLVFMLDVDEVWA